VPVLPRPSRKRPNRREIETELFRRLTSGLLRIEGRDFVAFGEQARREAAWIAEVSHD
jgi:hypothetical protein